MGANFKRAIKEWGIAEFSRWLLPDGQFLDLQGGDDHRIVGYCCKNDWREFIQDGAMSLHYDPNSRYLWIRTIGPSFAQMQALENAYNDGYFRVTYLKVDLYEFNTWNDYEVKEITIDDSEMAKLYLTDQIAYRCYMSEMEEDY